MSPASLTRHPFFLPVLNQETEGREFLSDAQLAEYERAFPEFAARARTARAVRANAAVVREVVDRILDVYPLKDAFALYHEKCVRDVTLVLRYNILAMLLGDEKWLKDKMLIWFKTIAQSLRYPDRRPAKRRVLTDPKQVAECEALKPWQRCIYETYGFLDLRLSQVLPPEDYAEISAYLALTTYTLSHD